MRHRLLAIPILLSLIAVHATSPPPLGATHGAVAAPLRCSGERWAVKTLSDDDAPLVNLSPVSASVTDLTAIPPPDSLPRLSRVAPTELTTYTVTADLVSAKLEDDGDIHLVVADPIDAKKTLNVHFPDTANCSLSADQALIDQMQAARDAYVAAFGTPSAARTTALTGSAQITGVGFFDVPQGGGAAAPKGIDLHPALAFTQLNPGQ